MKNFSQSALSYIEALENSSARLGAWETFSALGLPKTVDEVWRYAPLRELDLDHFEVRSPDHVPALSNFARELGERAGLVVRVLDGAVVEVTGALEGVNVECVESTWSSKYANDAFAQLNCALSPYTITLRVADGAHVVTPIVILNSTSTDASFPQVNITLGRSAQASVVEYLDGGVDALVVPLAEYDLADNSSLQVSTYQRLDASAWHIARSTGSLGRDARLRQAVISIGAHYNRSRNDAQFLGAGAENELRTTFLGSGNQVHDFRTHQFHRVGRTHSTLLSKGAVADASRSVYTGMIEIEKGAKRTDARQTNHNLLLSPHAHADSVPNLDIRENDVMCAHASSVGPLDELQRWYLESRGVTRPDAERLMIQGFFYEMLATLPSELAEVVERDLGETLHHVEIVTP
ncbi:MAG: SufD family Fe-S cluster assembly protein [Acidimicrobiaceae bacterium]|nr:SufD family Fe-S cluster assembly protein [Acidimicrobiaceae bacterium]